jgi:ABC-2 type transport system permease protein
MSLLGTQIGVLARRAMLKTLRQPFQLFPIVFFPLIPLAVNASGPTAATRLPGFPTNSYISFASAVAFIQVGMFSLINTGTNLAEDIESGFFNRLALTPLRRVSLIAGLLVGVAALGVLQAAVYVLMGLVAGAQLDAGAGGVLVILVLGSLTVVSVVALAAGMRMTGDGVDIFGLYGLALLLTLVGYGWAAGVAFRFRSIQAGPLMQTLVFLLLFVAPVYVPLSLLKGWIHAVASVNPATAFLDAGRGLISGVQDHTALAFACALGSILLFGIWMLTGLHSAENAP